MCHEATVLGSETDASGMRCLLCENEGESSQHTDGFLPQFRAEFSLNYADLSLWNSGQINCVVRKASNVHGDTLGRWFLSPLETGFSFFFHKK